MTQTSNEIICSMKKAGSELFSTSRTQEEEEVALVSFVFSSKFFDHLAQPIQLRQTNRQSIELLLADACYLSLACSTRKATIGAIILLRPSRFSEVEKISKIWEHNFSSPEGEKVTVDKTLKKKGRSSLRSLFFKTKDLLNLLV